MKFIIKQVGSRRADPIGSNENSGLYIYDFCRSKGWIKSDDWLTNKRGNGWNNLETNGNYTKFKLELIK